jgi:glycosyltransferase involved in cell wall biosynthesis
LPRVTINVLHVDTERGWRGGERQTLWLARELSRRGYGTVVAARANEPLAERASAESLDVVPCNPRSEIDVFAAGGLRRVIRRRNVDIVHAHTAHAVALAALATIGTRVPFVVARRVDFKLRDNFGTRLKYHHAAKFIAVSAAVARVLESDGIAASRIAVVPDGADVARRVIPATHVVLSEFGIPRESRIAVQVAQLVAHKDPVNFVRAIGHARASVPDLHGLLVGDGPLRGDVERAVRELGLESAVHLAGYRTDADALLAAADVAVLSSREEGMGSVLLDALLFGRPIAATRAGGIPEVVGDDCGLLAPIGDATALGDAIARIANDPTLAARFGERGRGRAQEFSVERMADRTIEVYETVLAAARYDA